MTVKIYKRPNNFSVYVYIANEITDSFVNDEVVVCETAEGLKFREAIISDQKTKPLHETNNIKRLAFWLNTMNFENLIGNWSLIKEGDWYILDEKLD